MSATDELLANNEAYARSFEKGDHEHGGPGYASPQAAREQPPEQFVYVD